MLSYRRQWCGWITIVFLYSASDLTVYIHITNDGSTVGDIRVAYRTVYASGEVRFHNLVFITVVCACWV